MAFFSDMKSLVRSATLGLLGVKNSTQYRIAEVERHLHSPERWIGAAAVPVGTTHAADNPTLTGFMTTAGNNTFGPWVLIVGSTDLPVRPGMAYADPNRVEVFDVSAQADADPHLVQFAHGTVDAATAHAAGDYTEASFVPLRGEGRAPFVMQDRRVAVGNMVWARHWTKGENATTLEFLVGIHEYEG